MAERGGNGRGKEPVFVSQKSVVASQHHDGLDEDRVACIYNKALCRVRSLARRLGKVQARG
eukprot:7352651-Alexandrium_andersonii.AAC.1